MGEFGHLLLKVTSEQMKRQDNVLISPFSVHTALSMVVPGARGLTKEEMVRTLHSGRIAPGGLQNVFSQITGRKHRNTTTPGQVFPGKSHNSFNDDNQYIDLSIMRKHKGLS